MAPRKRTPPEWREFEALVARIEADVTRAGFKVTSPDRIRCKITGRLREVDASIRRTNGDGPLITIECRKRHARQDVTWIEQLATKRQSIGAERTIAVSSSGFSPEARMVAKHHCIDLRLMSDVSIDEINRSTCLDFVIFHHRRCGIARVGFRLFVENWTLPELDSVDSIVPAEFDPFKPIFKNVDSGAYWSINDLWRDLQAETDPFEGIPKGAPPLIRTACFSYPGNVTVDTDSGPIVIGDVLLSVAVWIEPEMVGLSDAAKVRYSSASGAVQRVEFCAQNGGVSQGISLQYPDSSKDTKELRVGIWPVDHGLTKP